MFVINYALLNRTSDGTQSAIAVAGVFVAGETKSISLVDAGVLNKNNGLLISGSDDESGLPSTEYFLPDLPSEIFAAIRTKGVLIKDIQTGEDVAFSATQVESFN